jgi:hypothetical protein
MLGFFCCECCGNPGLKVKIKTQNFITGLCINCLREISDFYIKLMEESE